MSGVVAYLCDSVIWSAMWFLIGVLSTLATQNVIELWRTK